MSTSVSGTEAYAVSENGLQESFDGAEMYCKVWNDHGDEIESEHFTLKMYQTNVDRNITIRLPEVDETYAHYIADVNSIVPAELVIDKEQFYIYPMDAEGKYIPGASSMNDDDVFKAGRRYAFCFNMYLPEYVSPSAIYQFNTKGMIVNGEEHRAADAVNENELSFTDFWKTPVLVERLKGDMNDDGTITADDAQMALMAYINLLASKPSGITEQQEKIADVDGSGTITAEDAQYILVSPH